MYLQSTLLTGYEQKNLKLEDEDKRKKTYRRKKQIIPSNRKHAWFYQSNIHSNGKNLL